MSGIFKKLFGSHIIVIIVSFSILTVTIGYFMKNYYEDITVDKLALSAKLLKEVIKDSLIKNDMKKMQSLTKILAVETNTRITVIYPDGIVMGDSTEDPHQMENHANRPEIKDALAGKVGKNIHYSHTLKTDMLYVAVPVLEKGKLFGIVRISEPLSYVKAGLAHIQKIILFSILVGMLIAFGLSFLTNASLVKPLVKMRNIAEQMAKGNYRQKLEINSADELGHLAASFNTLSSEVQRKITVVTEFVANVSHEIKTPITAIGGAVETLLSGAIHNEKEAREFLEIALNHTNRLNNIVDDLLTLSKIETKEIKIDFVPVNLKDIINNVIKLLEDSIHLKNQFIDIDIPADIPEIPADEKKLEQVFFNLLDNAIKFTSDSGKIFITAQNLSDMVKIGISDTGIGIPAGHIDRIFERFYRVDVARSRDMGGTGLGLSIVKHIIQLHNGRITVTSQPGNGSVFSVFLPKTV